MLKGKAMSHLVEQNKKKILLHVCCAPCSSHVLQLLEEEYNITVFFYNPNITAEEEYIKRIEELKRFVAVAPFTKDVIIEEGKYEPDEFFVMSEGLENEPERGSRCYKCYEMRMRKTALYAKEKGYDIFTTTLSISPHKNAAWLNEIGQRLSEEIGVKYLYSDFKKKDGYSNSIRLSKEYGLYRQDYCGCIYSKRQAEERKKNTL
ncbi:MAG: epoxyqueuosine reductase QueH [Lachnospiraceae bacterium]|nr:epoxyqueuosine reductase QueH [Lachnospiraceae bacterium]